MMAGFEEVDHELVGWCEPRLGAPYEYMDDKPYVPKETWKEPEFVYFRKINGYAIQWHPEGMQTNSAATKYVLDYITNKEKERADQFSTVTCDC